MLLLFGAILSFSKILKTPIKRMHKILTYKKPFIYMILSLHEYSGSYNVVNNRYLKSGIFIS